MSIGTDVAAQTKAASGNLPTTTDGGEPESAASIATTPEDTEFRLLHSLPVEIMLYMAREFLSGEALLRLAATDREMRAIADDPQIWAGLFARRGLPFVKAEAGPGVDLPHQLLRVAPELSLLGDLDTVGMLKVLYFAPASLRSLATTVGAQTDPESFNLLVVRLQGLDKICRHMSYQTDSDLAATAESFATKAFDDPRNPICDGPPDGTSASTPLVGFPEGDFYLPCSYSLPDLWQCLTPGCESVRCGRTCACHALGHFTLHNRANQAANVAALLTGRNPGAASPTPGSSHETVIKLSTMEMWCYTCERWLGVTESHPLENLRVQTIAARLLGLDSPFDVPSHVNAAGTAGTVDAKTKNPRRDATMSEWLLNQRRQEERLWSTTWDRDQGHIHLLGQPFVSSWNAFLIGNGPPPPANHEHTSLYIPGSNPPVINPNAHFLGVSFLSDRHRALLDSRYPCTTHPPVSELSIPETPEYASLRRFVGMHKRTAADEEWDLIDENDPDVQQGWEEGFAAGLLL